MSRLRTGLAIHGARVALTPARAFTSHLRRRYKEQYQGRYMRAAWIFGIDLFLLGACLGLLVINVWLFVVVPHKTSGIDVVLFTPPIKTASPLAFEVQLAVQDGKKHDNVLLSWDLPAHTEIVSSSPNISIDRKMFIGTLEPHVTTTVRIAVRLFVSGSSTRIGVRLQDGAEQFSGTDVRPLIGSGLELTPLMQATQAVSGARIPFLLTNTTPVPIDSIQVIGGDAYMEHGEKRKTFSLGPHASARLLVDAHPDSTVRIMVGEAALLSRSIVVRPTSTQNIPRINLPVTMPGHPAVITTITTEPFRLLVVHPALKTKEGYQIFDVARGESQITLPLDPEYTQAIDSWFVIPFQEKEEDQVLFSPVLSRGTTSFRLIPLARYYTATGDQLGIGPLPPRVGQTTKYWIHWQLQPIQCDLSRVRILMPLGENVQLTGRIALPDGGTLQQEGDDVVWTFPFLPKAEHSLYASFEVALTPTPQMRGKSVELLKQGRMEAIENRYDATIENVIASVDTRLEGDEKAKGKGVVK